MTIHLTQRQRLIVGAGYLIVLAALYWFMQLWIPESANPALFWLQSGALMIILGRYVVEPFFTTPADAVVNGLALLISVTALTESNKSLLLGYTALIYYGVAVMAVAVVAIWLKDTKQPRSRKAARLAYKVAEFGGKSQVMFSVLYLLASYSFFGRTGHTTLYTNAIAVWICITFFDVVGLGVRQLWKAFDYLRKDVGLELGSAIGCENPLQHTVEVDLSTYRGPTPDYGDVVAIETTPGAGALGMVVSKAYLLGKQWLNVYALTDDKGETLSVSLRQKKLIDQPKTIFSSDNRAYRIDVSQDLQLEDKNKVENCWLFANRKKFVGYITRDSNINAVKFVILKDRGEDSRQLSEGTILKTTIYDEQTLYQVVDGNTRQERLEEQNSHGFIVGSARKLGAYVVSDQELVTRKWIPNIYAPVFFGFDGEVTADEIKTLAKTCIGRLPDTNLGIPVKDYQQLVTHNTGILGILGIGKSCLTYELIAKTCASTTAKIVCVDITDEYRDELPLYGLAIQIIDHTAIATAIQATYDTINKDRHKGGNHGDFRQQIRQALEAFIIHATDRVLIVNPDSWNVSLQTNEPKAKKVGTNWEDQAPMRELTVAEITRIISEELFELCKAKGRTPEARCLIVYEEAHSLVPEWSSASNDGDDRAANGTAKVILQGRKYGLGCFVITQRTANVSKSLLNQCNTIFALRVFDDTGKSFLANYIGDDYSDALPMLEERYVIATGKGLRLKQPVIIQLNDRAHVQV